jgi:hypothetical protein
MTMSFSFYTPLLQTALEGAASSLSVYRCTEVTVSDF